MIVAPPFDAALRDRLRALAEGAQPENPGAWAHEQRLGPLLHRLDPEGPWGPRKLQARAYATALVRWSRVLDHLALAQTALDGAQIPVLVLKGAALAALHYPVPAFRPMDDVDLLVAPETHDAAGQALEHVGFQRIDTAEHAAAYRAPDGLGTLELHRTLVSCARLFPMPWSALWPRRRALPEGGWTMGDADTLVHLALHAAFQHGFGVRVGQYLDFERLLASGVLQREGTAHVVANANARVCVAATLHLTAALFRIAIPEEWTEPVTAPVHRWLDAHAERPWELVRGLPLAQARWQLTDGVRAKAELLRATLFPEGLGAGRTMKRIATLGLAAGRNRLTAARRRA